MSLNKEDIKKIAFLARLELNNVEIKKYQEQLSSILGYINTLQEVVDCDLDVLGLGSEDYNCLRPDEAIDWPSDEKNIAIDQMIEKEDGQVKVNRVL